MPKPPTDNDRSKQVFILILSIILGYLIFATAAYLRRIGEYERILFLGSLGITLLAVVLWTYRSRRQLFHPLSLAGYFTYGVMTYFLILGLQGLPDPHTRSDEWASHFSITDKSVREIKLPGYPLPVGLELSIRLTFEPLSDGQRFLTAPRIGFVKQLPIRDTFSALDYRNGEAFQEKIFLAPISQSALKLEPGQEVIFRLFPSMLTDINPQKFCINSTQASLEKTLPTLNLPRPEDRVFIAWHLGNQYNLGKALNDWLSSQLPSAETWQKRFLQFDQLVRKKIFHPCGTNPKTSSVCYCGSPKLQK